MTLTINAGSTSLKYALFDERLKEITRGESAEKTIDKKQFQEMAENAKKFLTKQIAKCATYVKDKSLPTFDWQMHLDTDEGNAAEIKMMGGWGGDCVIINVISIEQTEISCFMRISRYL